MERRDGEYGKERMRVEIRKGEWKEENESRKKRRRDGKKRRRVEIREGEWKEEKESGKKEGGMERREGGYIKNRRRVKIREGGMEIREESWKEEKRRRGRKRRRKS